MMMVNIRSGTRNPLNMTRSPVCDWCV
jgi:hypothetical protein